MPSDAYDNRRQADIAKLLELQTEFHGVVSVTRTAGHPVTLVELEIKLKTARNARFPDETQVSNAVQIQLAARYPFDSPKVVVTTPIWNPNIWPDGQICWEMLGKKWSPTYNLAMVVKGVMQILALDPAIINLASPANSEASKWYAAASRRNPSIFPTVRLDSLRAPAQRTIQWRTIK